MPFRAPDPESGVSTNFTTWADGEREAILAKADNAAKEEGIGGSSGGVARAVARGAQGPHGPRKGAHAAARGGRGAAPRVALGAHRGQLLLRRAAGQGVTRGPVRGAQPTPRVSLHVSAELGGGLQELRVLGRRLRGPRRPPERARCLVRRRVEGAAREARGVPKAHGLELP